MSYNRIRLASFVLATALICAAVMDAQARRHRVYFRGGHFAGAHFARVDQSAAQPQVIGPAGVSGTRHFAHDPVTHNNLRGRYGYGYGWFGPVFWPYAYDDIFSDILWGYGLGGPFWDYGYDDLYRGLFSPFDYKDVAAYPPTEQALAAADAPASQKIDRRQAGTLSQISRMCGDSSNDTAGWPVDRIGQSVSLTAEQRAVFNEFADAAIRAAQTIKDACPIDVVFSPSARLETMQKRLEGMVQAVAVVGPPLDRLYGLLSDEQKARLDAVNEQYQRDRRATAGCNAALGATRWAAEQIDRAVQPTPEQQAKLDALKTAMAAAANDLSDVCPSSLPTTPPARLKAMARQLNVLLGAVKNVRATLDDLYASLSDEQKSQFNALGRQRSAKQ
jgi:LTXXQ motif family protein